MQLPLVCWFQVIQYNVTIYNGAEVVITTSQRLIYWEQHIVSMSFEPVSELITNFISRCYVVAKCNIKHIALLKSHIALPKSHIALTTKRPSGIIKLNIVS